MSDFSIFETVYLFFYSIALPMNLVFHCTIFTGAFLVAMKNEKLPHWHVAPLWWVGLCSLLCAISITLQYIFGPTFDLAYKNVGLILEVFLNGFLALLAGTFIFMFFFKRNPSPAPSKSTTRNKKVVSVKKTKPTKIKK